MFYNLKSVFGTKYQIILQFRGWDMNTQMFDDIKGVTRSRKSKKTYNAKSPSPFKGYCRTGNLINIYVIIPASKAFKMQYRFEKQFDSLIR